MKLHSIAVLATLAVALFGAGTTSARPSTGQARTVQVTAKDFSFALSKKTVPHGMVTFVLRNAGHAPHDFAIAGHHSKTIGPGKTTRLTVNLKRGRWQYRCTVDNHAGLGMKGFLRAT